MTPLRPNARVGIDGDELSAAEGAVARVRVCLSLGVAHDSATVRCWPGSRFAGAAPGAPMTVQLGARDEEELVWTGVVDRVHHEAAVLVVEGLSDTVGLSGLRLSRSYLDQTIADIVSDLASDVAVDEVESDVSLAAYHVDNRRSAWSYVQELAALAGADVASSAQGGLRFVPPRTGSADHTLRYGAEVLAWSSGRASPSVPAAAVAHGAGSEAGSEQWHWLRRDVGGGDGPLRDVAAFSTKDAADHLTTALESQAAAGGTGGRLTLTGAPDVRPGDLLEVVDLPVGDLGLLRARAVEQVLDGSAGFVTLVTAEGVPA